MGRRKLSFWQATAVGLGNIIGTGIFVIRTRMTPFYKSKPRRTLLLSSLLVFVAALIVPFTPLGDLFQSVQPPLTFYLLLALLILAYLALVELAKRLFYGRYGS